MKKQNAAHKDSGSAALLDALINWFGLNSDDELADFLEVDRSVISQIRNCQQLPSLGLLSHIHEISGLDPNQLRAFISRPRQHFDSEKLMKG